MNKLEQAARQAFETWWEREGQEFLFALNTTTDDDIKLVAEIAWKNGAYCAEQADGEQWSPNDMAYRPSGLSMEQAEQEPVAERKAQVNELIKESARLIASTSDEGDRYLTAVDTLRNAYRLGLKDAAPVRTKDLTPHEITALIREGAADGGWQGFAQRVIAADREKNK